MQNLFLLCTLARKSGLILRICFDLLGALVCMRTFSYCEVSLDVKNLFGFRKFVLNSLFFRIDILILDI